MVDIMRSDFSRVFTIQYKAGPTNVPTYQGLWRAGSFSWDRGDVSLIRIPDPDEYGKFLTVDKVPGEEGNPTISLMARYTMNLSDMLKLAKAGCDFDAQVHMGRCKDPKLFDAGWEKVLIIEGVRATSYSTEDLGALQPSDRAAPTEEIAIEGEDAYEVVALEFAQQATTQVVQEVIDIVVCDAESCGLCGLPSDGCQIVFALTLSAGGSPGLAAEIVYTEDGGATWNDTNISTLAANEDPDELACVGENLVVVSQDSCSLHWANIADVLNAAETWAEVATGFVCATGAPIAISSIGPANTWIVGAGGYIYFTDDPTNGVDVQDAGVATTSQLNAVHALDLNNVVAVGNSNAVVRTSNGGLTWQSITGPAVGINLNAIWMKTKTEWWIGTANGRLWYTRDSGDNWTQKSFPGSGAGSVRDIVFVTPSVGYMSHDTAAPAGRILRTINGGFSWYILPEGSGTLPANDRFNHLAICTNPNIVYGGGLADNATDGIIVKGIGS